MRVRRLVNNDMTFGQGIGNIAIDVEAVRQRVATRLRLLLGEWFLDTDAGIPYIQRIVEKPTDLGFAEAVLKRKVLETEGIFSIDSWGMVYDSRTRELTVTCSVSTTYGVAIENIEVTL